MNAAERAHWLSVSPPLAVDGVVRSARSAPRPVVPLAVLDLTFHVQGIALLTLRGEHDLDGCQRLADALAAAEARLHVLVDLSDCSFIDSSVIAVLFLARERLVARGGRLGILIPRDATAIRRIAEVTALGAALPIHDTMSAALSSLTPLDSQ